MSDIGLTDSAILLLSLGEEEAAEVFKHLGAKEAQKIGHTMTRLGAITKDKMQEVLGRFHARAEQETSIGTDADGYVRSVLTKALGDDKGTLLLDRILQGGDASGIESLKWMDPASVAELIRNEHPQIVASILIHLESDHAAGILRHLTDRVRNDVLLRIATLDGIQPTALRELNDVLAKMLAGSDNLKKSALGGVSAAANILNYLGTSVEADVLDAVREHDEELAQKIVDQMFVFENLLEIDDRGIQALLREVQADTLIVALRGANEALLEKIMKNMSTRAADLLRDDLDAKGPVRVSDVEAQQKEILKIARRMADDGTIMLGNKGDEQFI